MIVSALKQLVMNYKIHPILVNFTAALVPVSLASDVLARATGEESLGQAAWWALVYAGAVTPFTALTGWLFWMKDDVGVSGMTVHKWLGTALAALVPALLLWRWRFQRRRARPDALYLAFALAIVAALVYQGALGGTQVFKDM